MNPFKKSKDCVSDMSSAKKEEKNGAEEKSTPSPSQFPNSFKKLGAKLKAKKKSFKKS